MLILTWSRKPVQVSQIFSTTTFLPFRPFPIRLSTLLSGVQGTWCYLLLSDISAPINHQSAHYMCMSLPCVCVCVGLCVCAGGGHASGRFLVNIDLGDGSVNDFIIWDKARVEQEVRVFGFGLRSDAWSWIPKISYFGLQHSNRKFLCITCELTCNVS